MPKKIIGLFTALLCAVTVAGCSTKPTEPEKPVDDNKVVEPAAKAELLLMALNASQQRLLLLKETRFCLPTLMIISICQRQMLLVFQTV